MFRQRLGSRAISFFGARFCVVLDAAHRDSSTLALLYAAARRLRVIRFVNDSRPSLASLPFFLFVFDRTDTLFNASLSFKPLQCPFSRCDFLSRKSENRF